MQRHHRAAAAFFDRTCDITDLITNVAGCACGYLIGLPLAQPLQRLGERLDRTEKTGAAEAAAPVYDLAQVHSSESRNSSVIHHRPAIPTSA